MKFFFYMAVFFIFFSCDSDDSVSSNAESDDFDRIYVTLQGTDKVAIVNASTLEVVEQVDVVLDMMNGDMGSNMDGDMGGNMDGDMDDSMMSMNTPHYVALDEENGYWFISANYAVTSSSSAFSFFSADSVSELAASEPSSMTLRSSSSSFSSVF